MNSREPLRTPSRVRPSPRILALLLLPVLAPEQAGAAPRPRPSAGVALRFIPEPPIAYLRSIDPLPLRFAPDPVPPAPWPETLEPNSIPAAATTVPSPSAPPAEAAPAASPGPAPADVASSNSGAGATTASTAGEASSPQVRAETPGRPASPILADELRPTVRPEDFLPFFILPGSNEGGPALIAPVPPQAPAPSSQPPSSARFLQTR